MKLSIELRPGEGGEDAKLLVQDQAAIYLRYVDRVGAKAEITDQDHG